MTDDGAHSPPLPFVAPLASEWYDEPTDNVHVNLVRLLAGIAASMRSGNLVATPSAQATLSTGPWQALPYELYPQGDWTHVLLSSPLANFRILDREHVRLYGKGTHNFSGLLGRPRLDAGDSACSVTLYAAEVGGALVLYGGKTGRETALELRLEGKTVSVHAYDPNSKATTLMQGSGPPGNTTLMLTRRGDTFAGWIDGELVWRGSLPFLMPPARVLLRALGDSRFAEGRERSAIFGPVRVRGVIGESRISGSVVSAGGEPVPDAWVHIAGDPFCQAQTDASGRFTLSLTPIGGDEIIAAAEGFEFVRQALPAGGTSDEDDAGGRDGTSDASRTGITANADDAVNAGNKRRSLTIELPRLAPHRPEYPRPEFDRSHWWVNLNGTWRFALDPYDIGREEGWQSLDAPYQAAIRVPFPWTSLMAVGEESLVADHRYTGIWSGYTGTAWYKRTVRIPDDAPGGTIGVLKFLSVNAQADVYWDGEPIASHDGGFDPFECEIGELRPGAEHTLVVRVHYPSEIDPTDVLVGKQGWWFTHAPGIWQTVWLESRERTGHITRFHVRGDVRFNPAAKLSGHPNSAAFHVKVAAKGGATGITLTVIDPHGAVIREENLSLEGQDLNDGGIREPDLPHPSGGVRGSPGRGAALQAEERFVEAVIPVEQPALWDLESPNLYRLEARLTADGHVIDSVKTYAGLREIRCDWAPGHSPDEAADAADQYQYVYLNGRPVYLVGILDQAYNPWGVYTYRSYGPKELAGSIQNDLEIAKELGYNLIRLHIKSNEPLWLYEAARTGILVWDELPNYRGIAERPGWRRLEKLFEALHERDYNCPAIVIRSIINESWGAEDMRVNPFTQEKIKELRRPPAAARAPLLGRRQFSRPRVPQPPHRHRHQRRAHLLAGLVGLEAAHRLRTSQIYAGSEYNFHSGTHEPDEAGAARQSGQPYVISEFTSHGRKSLALRMFPKIAGFVKIDLVDQEWERFTPYTYTRNRRPLPFLDADLRPLGDEMEHSLDAVFIDAPPVNFIAPGALHVGPGVRGRFPPRPDRCPPHPAHPLRRPASPGGSRRRNVFRRREVAPPL